MDVDASQEAGHGVMLFHVRDDYKHTNLQDPPPPTAVEPILFLSRLLTPAEKSYWPTELEVSCIVWAIRKARHMIEAAPEDLTPIAYTDHIATINLATSHTTASPDRLNLRLVRASQYIQQFRIKIHHRSGRSNLIAHALSRLPSKAPTQPKPDDDLDALAVDVLDTSYVFLTSAVEMSPAFRQKLLQGSSLKCYNGLDLLDNFAPTVMEDSSFEGATTATLRENLNKWAASAKHQEQNVPPGQEHHIQSGRYRYFLMVDQEALGSVLNESELDFSESAFVRLIDGQWES
ncbi:hypothetical protein PENDEC_c039G03438 [Penicillium decumbens]|uniref:Reverse transcriptase RNase H-like domain-containing protein n=1 Tax=Penicillium decumbens TaxID=69771 RepID=A0A1V6NS35_PENDC|nr:hypothetical protein PENDEC_c039G03438 [Penicillium decumbens]